MAAAADRSCSMAETRNATRATRYWIPCIHDSPFLEPALWPSIRDIICFDATSHIGPRANPPKGKVIKRFCCIFKRESRGTDLVEVISNSRTSSQLVRNSAARVVQLADSFTLRHGRD